MILPIITYSEFSSLSEKDYLLIEAGNDQPAFEKEHLKGAVYLDLDKDLANVPADATLGGRHPLPTIETFTKRLQKLGVSKNSSVIIYDRNFGANAAARCWWMLTALGMKNVQVLSGGFQFAKNNGAITTGKVEINSAVESEFSKEWLHPTVAIEELKSRLEDNSLNMLDVRSPERHQGVSEPIDPIAGSIPSAKNIFFKENLNQDGTFKSKEELIKIYQPLFRENNGLIVHCGSGVTACHTILAMVHAGFAMPTLYVGSWSEWCRNLK